MMEAWAEAIGFELDSDGRPSLATVVSHIRGAITEAGFVSQGRITSGIKEAYRPFSVEGAVLRNVVDDALRVLLLSGDVEQFSTSAGRGYAATSPRRIVWGGETTAVLGAVPDCSSDAIIRRVSLQVEARDVLPSLNLADELGLPEWRSILVELDGADSLSNSAAALFANAQARAVGGERFALDGGDNVAVVSGRGEFFGKAEDAPSGRWQHVGRDGCFPAKIRVGYTARNVVLHVSGTTANLWQPPTKDIWRWLVVGHTLAHGDPVLRYDHASCKLDFLTPPPRQVERGVLIAGTRIGAWSWIVDEWAYALIAGLMGSPR